MAEWLPYRESFLDEMLRHEGLGDFDTLPPCIDCGEASASFKCADCFGQGLLCQECTVKAHRLLPLHGTKVCFYFLPVFSYKLIPLISGGTGTSLRKSASNHSV